MPDILFVNACVRRNSRTKRLADALIERLNGTIMEVKLTDLCQQPLTEDILERRNALIRHANYEDKMFDQAHFFCEAKQIVIAAPYWDLSFPALLKIYIEQIMVNGLTFRYSEEGYPISLCHAKRLFYVSTSGGPVLSGNEGFQYVKQLGKSFFSIEDIRLIQAENLDIVGNDPDRIVEETICKIREMEL